MPLELLVVFVTFVCNSLRVLFQNEAALLAVRHAKDRVDHVCVEAAIDKVRAAKGMR